MADAFAEQMILLDENTKRNISKLTKVAILASIRVFS